MANTHLSVAEMQGLYRPFTITERVVQKIWLRGDFARRDLNLLDGRRMEIRSGGAWNLLGGPDFRDARLVIAGREIAGDVEVHFHAADWRAHGHAEDRAYDNVELHVVLFPPTPGERVARHRDGREIATLVLLPLLHRDLEEYASDDALEGITERDAWERFAELAALPTENLRQVLKKQAEERWRQKVHFAKVRIERLGFVGAAHQVALEILGYRHNRATMLRVATHHPIETWADTVETDVVFAEFTDSWRIQGLRPANHPRTRLAQYQRWIRARPNWPARLFAMADLLDIGPGGNESTETAGAGASARKAFGLTKLRRDLAREVTGEAIGGTRFDNLVCDGFLPLVAAARPDVEVFGVWFNWFLGDVPAQVRSALPKLGVTSRDGEPVNHGWAQGLLGWLIARDARASC